ncbi:MAG TPA: FAD-dependent oxidoreductase, partial [Armatimonadetes bacterium]|nr:FAD-dependent oxidoreductase [Armatimonadota bacterium]
HPIHRRAVEFTFHQNGTIAWFDGTMWYGITSFQPNRWYRIRVIANPLHGACDLYVNGEKRNTEPLPFWNSVPYVDTFFLSHFTHRGEEDDVYVGSVKLGEAPVPPTPMLLTVNATSPTSVRLHWLPVFYGHVARFRIYRANKLVATVPANRTQWVERGLQPGTAYAYAVSAIDDATPPNESIWTFPEMVITHPLNYPNRPSRPLSNYDVVIIGATPAGVAAGVMAARLGLTVALSNESERLGGMMASGLGRTDFRYRQSAGGIFLEFVQRCYELYRNAYGENSRAKRDCNAGYFFEPRIAAFLFERFVAEHQNIHLYAHHRLVKVHKRHKRIISADMLNMRTGRQITLRGRIFIDATYEGDLSALAGVPYRIGRESREEYGEEHAGVIYFDYRAQRKLTGSTGEGDYRVQAYNYRLCITKRPDWRIRISKPKHYNRKAYLSLLEDFRTGRVTHKKPQKMLKMKSKKRDSSFKKWTDAHK